jgi:hypothetical protein
MFLKIIKISFILIKFVFIGENTSFNSHLNNFLPVNNSLIDYPGSRYDRAFEIASDVINENFTARITLYFISLLGRQNANLWRMARNEVRQITQKNY